MVILGRFPSWITTVIVIIIIISFGIITIIISSFVIIIIIIPPLLPPPLPPLASRGDPGNTVIRLYKYVPPLWGLWDFLPYYHILGSEDLGRGGGKVAIKHSLSSDHFPEALTNARFTPFETWSNSAVFHDFNTALLVDRSLARGTLIRKLVKKWCQKPRVLRKN